jgi:hypothetical protein
LVADRSDKARAGPAVPGYSTDSRGLEGIIVAFAETRMREADERRIASTLPALDLAVWPHQGLRWVPWKGYLVP